MTEEWRVTSDAAYEVSDWGRVRSYATVGSRLGTRQQTPRILRVGSCSYGYPHVRLGRRKCFNVHVLVALAFLGPCPPGQEVRHKDDDTRNPRAENLEYGTRKDNVQDAIQRGRFVERATDAPRDERGRFV